MSTLAPEVAARSAASDLRFAHAARALESLRPADEDVPPRGVVAGSAGSGKSTALRRLRAMAAESGFVSTAWRPGTDIAGVPVDELLLVDDAHLLDGTVLSGLVDRAQNPDAGLVVAARSWPAPPELTSLTRILEHSADTVLLSDIVRADLRESLSPSSSCDERIAYSTGGIAWLAHECVAAHEGAECAGDADHTEMDLALELRIAHRLDLVNPALRHRIEALAIGATSAVVDGDDEDALIAEGYAEGLLLRSGRPAPLVAAAARRCMPTHRFVELFRAHAVDFVPDPAVADSFEGVFDPDLAHAYATRARDAVGTDPDLAVALYERALACGADHDATAPGRAYAAWAAGDLDAVSALLDGRRLADGDADRDLMADTAASAWTERGMMSLADQTYRAFASSATASRTRALLAAAGSGVPLSDDSPEAASHDGIAPATIDITMRMLARGLRTTLTAAVPTTALTDLQRASELYTASHVCTPLPELPAVIAAIAAIGTGDLATAHACVHDALRNGQGGAAQQPHLQLWHAWLSLQRERPADARDALAAATSHRRTLSPRDDAFAAAITVGLARRHEDSAGLAAAWEAAKPRLQRTEPDLYMLLPLGELIISAARVGDIAWAQCAFEAGLTLVADLGDPPVWSAPLHWAGIQRGILLNRPTDLAPHARALVAAAPNNRLAAMMAQAGRVWTAVLSGHVDAEAVEAAAHGLASVGLAWDGARLAGHGAGRCEDRKVISRLLACARELHPRETTRPDASPTSGSADGDADGVLSEREREVAELVVQGKTYAEIGAAIFISPRTAEHHIAHIRRRVNASSRSDLLSKLRIILDDSSRDDAASQGGRS